jgi:acetoin utilization deacetylase AcuC-like enzyme
VKAVYTELHRSHDPQFFLVRGVVKRTTEQPERADRLLAGLKAGNHHLVEPTMFGQGPRARVHSPEYLTFLAEYPARVARYADVMPSGLSRMSLAPIQDRPVNGEFE